MPPEWMWTLPDDLEDWFEEVAQRREERYGGGDDEMKDASDMMSNEYTKGRR